MKHFLSIVDLSPDSLLGLLQVARDLKAARLKEGNEPILRGKTLGLLFQKPSLRTRVSFEVGMIHLGGAVLYLSPNEIRLGERESVPDVARVLGRYVDGIMARVFAHADVLALAEYARVPVINGLSDYNHPCQALADILTIWEKHGELRGVDLAYIGDGNNVCTSLMFAAAKLGMDMSVASPEGYEPASDVLAMAQEFAARSGSKVAVTNDPDKAASGADVIYTDVWTSMGQETETEARHRVFRPYQVNERLVGLASPQAIVMHCLPAHRGEEITDAVVDGPQSVVFDQAENRMHAQKAILAKLLA